MRKIVFFHSQDELLWHCGRSLDDIIAGEAPNIWSHIELLRQLKTAKDWVVETCRVDDIYAAGGYRAAESLIIDKCSDSAYALFLVTARPQFLADRTLRAVKNSCPDTRIILHSHDERRYQSIMTRCIGADADAILVSEDPLGAELLRREFGNAAFFPYPSRVAFPPSDDPDREYDVSFVGSDKNRRVEFLRAVSEALPHRKYRFAVPKRPYYLSPDRLVLEQIRDITYRSKINLVFNEKTPGVFHISTRFWQIVTCRALALVEHVPELEYLFDVEDDLFVFRDADELIEKIEFILDPDNRELVEKKRKAAYARATEVCLEDLVEMIDGLQSGSEILAGLKHPAALESAPIEVRRPSNKRYRATRYQYLFDFLRKGQFRKAVPELHVLKYGLPRIDFVKEIRRARRMRRRLEER